MYVTVNLLSWTVEQVRDTHEEAVEAADGDDCLAAYPNPVPSSVVSGDRITLRFEAGP